MNEEQKFKVGDRVIKDKGDYVFRGTVVSAFRKITPGEYGCVNQPMEGPWRYVAQNRDGILHVFSDAQIRLVTPGEMMAP